MLWIIGKIIFILNPNKYAYLCYIVTPGSKKGNFDIKIQFDIDLCINIHSFQIISFGGYCYTFVCDDIMISYWNVFNFK